MAAPFAGLTVSRFSAPDSGTTPRIVAVMPEPIVATATMTTPGTGGNPYAINDIIANNATAGSVVPFAFLVGREANGGFSMEGFRLELAASTDTGFRNFPLAMHFFETSPVFNVGDDGAFDLNVSVAGWRDYVTVTMNKGFGAGAQAALVGVGSPTSGGRVQFKSDANGYIYGVLTAAAQITRSQVAHTFNARVEGYAL